ncbi:MAG: toll/interleukin-1 receptor domain-containing protein [Oscillospiraceae bacterium]|nr:toll/interleukin-1 receptor domain-containing protein [Oscillospiraceae bacterium]
MKVFISWSGSKSKEVALIFRDWLPTVIQAIEPFVSSEDIDKGARWNTDIAQELKESNFGLICVTKDNLAAPWLNFEAGALSKTIDNTFVAPVLFDVKPSELKGSPISQFQATSFTKDDMKRLIETLNTAAGNCLSPVRLDKAFELCYPDLERSLNELKKASAQEKESASDQSPTHMDSNILEELLETARNTQRLLGNTDTKLYNNIDEVQKKIDSIVERLERQHDLDIRRVTRRIRPIFVEELLLHRYDNESANNIFPYNILMALASYKEDFPWLYDAGREVVKIINSNVKKADKLLAVDKFKNVVEYTYSHPAFREMYGSRKETLLLFRELPMLLSNELK